ncbi:MAG TPA: hypothetical protein VFR18_10025 [Terriglobia bacterium]|nr:hypothetical protein [Terriglobia bacterium]
MKRITILSALILLTLSACSPSAETPAATEPVSQPEPSAPVAASPVETPAPSSSVLSTTYVDAATALAADDTKKAKESLTALANESSGELKTLAQAAADAGDLEAMREKFKALSNLATTMELPPDHAVAFCPMYKGGAKWVQKKGTLANPYFGSTMLTCGSFVN